MIGFLIVLAVMFFMVAGLILLVRAIMARLSRWAKAYHGLAKRYGAKVSFSGTKPRLNFSYADAPCVLKNTSSRRKNNRRTQLSIKWPDRSIKLYVSSLGNPIGFLKSWQLKPVSLPDYETASDLTILSNRNGMALQLLTLTTLWQIRQLIRHTGNPGIEVFLNNGQLKISNPGHIKDAVQLDDFVRFGLELFDQFKLALNNDLEFLSDNEATVFTEVICPICSEQIQEELVTCVRCKTPHCQDCWEYNGQCATFACNETRFSNLGKPEVSKLS